MKVLENIVGQAPYPQFPTQPVPVEQFTHVGPFLVRSDVVQFVTDHPLLVAAAVAGTAGFIAYEAQKTFREGREARTKLHITPSRARAHRQLVVKH